MKALLLFLLLFALVACAHPDAIPASGPLPAPTPSLTFSADGRYAFPVAGDLSLISWTHYHWDGSNAVDIEARPDLTGDSAGFRDFINMPVVAVVDGTVRVADNEAGGLAYWLEGSDGRRYYYGHLSQQAVPDGTVVTAGQTLGRIGNTGRWTQYIEPHLHFAIASPGASDARWQPDVNAAEQLQVWFGRAWLELPVADYPVDRPAGSPLAVPYEIVESFAATQAAHADRGAARLQPATDGDTAVLATLGGEVNVMRATFYGLRVQVTNRAAGETVVYSGLQSTPLRDGSVVARGDTIGTLAAGSALHLMYFRDGVLTDPAVILP